MNFKNQECVQYTIHKEKGGLSVSVYLNKCQNDFMKWIQ